MADVIPIERALEKKEKNIGNNQNEKEKMLRELEETRENLAREVNLYRGAETETVQEAKNVIDIIDDHIKSAREKISNINEERLKILRRKVNYIKRRVELSETETRFPKDQI